jgi:TP901 family phage tail tape measure protein
LNIGTLTASLGFDVSGAMQSMTTFERTMITLTANIDRSLNVMANAMLKVSGSANVMAASSVGSINRIVVASKMASVEMGTVATSFASKIAAGNAAWAATSKANMAGNLVMGGGGKTTEIIPPKSPVITPIIDTRPAMTSLENLTNSLSRLSQRFRTFGYLASIVITAPMVMAGKAAFAMARDFEFSMAKIVGLVGLSKSKVDEFSKAILKMAPEVAQTPQALADALYFITSAGHKSAEALNILNVAARASTAGLGTTADVAKLLVFSMNAYVGENMSAAHAADIFVAAVREGAIEADGFTGALQKLLPIASSMGVSLGQVAGTLAALSLQGASAANASTYLLGVFNSLLKIKPSNQAGKALDDIHSSAIKLRNTLMSGPNGLMNVLLQIQEWSKTNPYLMSKIFGNVRSVTAELSLTGQNLVANQKVIESVVNAYGDLDKAVKAASTTIKVRYNSAIAQAQVSLISLGKSIATSFLPILNDMVKWLGKVTDRFNALTEEQKRNKLVHLAWLAAAGPVSLLISLIGYGLTGLITILGLARTGWIKLTAAMAGNPFNPAIIGILGLTVIYRELIRAEEAEHKARMSNYGKRNLDITLGTAEQLDAIATLSDAISKGMSNIGKLTDKERIDLQNNIESILEIYRSKKDDLLKIQKEGLKDDEWIIGQKAKIANLELSIYEESKRLAEETSKIRISGGVHEQVATFITGEIKGMQKQVNYLNTTLNDYRSQIKTNVKSELFIVESDIQHFTEVQGKFAAVRKSIAEFIKMIDDDLAANQKITDTWDELAKGLVYIERMTKISGGTFDATGAKLKLFNEIIEQLAKTDLPLTDVAFAKLIRDFVSMGGTFDDQKKKISEFKKIMDELSSSIAGAKMRQFIEPSFDIAASSLEAYKKAYEDYLQLVSKQINPANLITMPSNPSFGNAPMIAMLVNLKQLYDAYKKWQEIQEKTVTKNTLDLLQAEADAYGSMAGKIEVVNFEIQAEERSLRKMLQQRITGGEFVPDEKIKNAVKRIQELKGAYVDLQNAESLKYLNDMNKALDNAATNSELLSGVIEALKKKLEFMSAAGEGASETFKKTAKQMNDFLIMQKAIDILSNAFNDLFTSIFEGGKNLSEVLKGVMKNILQSIMQVISQMIAMRIIMSMFGGMGGMLGFMYPGLRTINPIMNIGNILGHAKGGMVPSGYPNDTYPALLSSGEKIIPLDKIQPQKMSFGEGEVIFRIGQDELYGILKKKVKKNSIY